MKTKYWVALLAALLLICVFLTWWGFGQSRDAQSVEVWSDGECLYTLPLNKNQTVTIRGEHGTNEIQIRDGAVAVIAADCPDGHCVNRGFCSGGAQIVCLPNRLVIKFVGKQEVDGTVG